ncbi:hypothetical protein D3C78_1895790 [compost metagenome]
MALQMHRACAVDIAQTWNIEAHDLAQMRGVGNKRIDFIVAGRRMQRRPLVPALAVQFHRVAHDSPFRVIGEELEL